MIDVSAFASDWIEELDEFLLPEAFIDAKTDGEKDTVVVDGATHMKAYDDPAYIDQAIQATDSFYQKHPARAGNTE